MSKKIPPTKNDIKVLVFGTFDLLHPGHKFFLQQAKQLGHQLIVVLTRTRVATKQKGEPISQSERRRLAEIKKLKFIEKVYLGQKNIDHKYFLVKKIKPDIICLGYDQPESVKKITRKLRDLGLNTNVIRLKSFFPTRYKSSILRKKHLAPGLL